MPSHGRHQKTIGGWIRSATLAGSLLLLVASARADWLDWRPSFKPAFKPQNTWKLQPELAANLRRVAVLPITAANGVRLDEDSCRMLEDTLRTELTRCGQFEVVMVSQDKLRRWTGQTQVRALDSLPGRLFSAAREDVAADLVLFVEVTDYQPYAPLRLGWHLKLVQADGQLAWWEADQLFDGGDDAVARGARQHEKKRSIAPKALRDGWKTEHSPKEFAAFSTGSLLGTLPRRTAADLR